MGILGDRRRKPAANTAAASLVRFVPTFVAMAVIALAFQLACWAGNRGLPEGGGGRGAVKSSIPIPAGVVLPVRLEKTISIKETHAAELLEVRIMQDVPLLGRGRLRAKSIIKGSILSVVRDSDGTGIEVTLKFNQIEDQKQILPASLSLRAIASYMAVRTAQVPFVGADAGTPTGWANTVQIGGDIRFGDGGPVRNRAKEKVGRGVIGGVLVHVRANPEKGCDGPVKGDDRLQALWLFSSDACGTYGLKDLQILHSGNTAPIGEIALHFDKEDAKLEVGTAMLLRVVTEP